MSSPLSQAWPARPGRLPIAPRATAEATSRVRRLALRAATGLVLIGAAWPVLAQSVQWEDYRGTSGLSSVTYIGDPAKPTFANLNNAGPIANLEAISADPANAVRTGTSANISYAQADNPLCNTALNGNSTACQYQAMGRVAYALIRFPQAGSYSMADAHDDNTEVQLSADYTNTNYRTASYDIPVGAVSAWTNSETDFANLGTFTAAQANSCALVRVYWTNQGGVTFNHLRWTRPDNVTEIIPASAFFDPSSGTSASGCSGAISGNATITLNKVVGSQRVQTSDQFRVAIGTSSGGTQVASATTSGSGTGQQATTSSQTVTLGPTYYLGDAMASGSGSTLSSYVAAIACTRNGDAFIPDGASPVWNVTPVANDKIICTITNTARPSVTIAKISTGGTGTFSFTGTNGVATQSLTTVSAGTAVSGTPSLLTAASTATTVSEGVLPTGYVLTGISCTGLGSGGTATPDLTARTVTLDAAATAMGSAITCTFTNRLQSADLTISKSDGATQMTVGEPSQYQIVVANSGPGAADGAVIKDPAVSGLSCTAVSCAVTSGAAQCPATGSVTVAALQSSSGIAIPTFPANSSLTFTVTCTAQ